MTEHLFRKAALDRLASPDQLDRLPAIEHPGRSLWVMGLGMLLLCGLCLIGFLGFESVASAEGRLTLTPAGTWEAVFLLPAGAPCINKEFSVKVRSGGMGHLPLDGFVSGIATLADGQQSVRVQLKVDSAMGMHEGDPCQVRVVPPHRGWLP